MSSISRNENLIQAGGFLEYSTLNKNLNKLFIDLKVPMSERNNTVLVCKNENVLAALGIKKSDLLTKSTLEKNIKIMLLED